MHVRWLSVWKPKRRMEVSKLVVLPFGPKLPCCTFSGTMGQCNGVNRNGKRLRSMLAHGLYYIIHGWWTCRPWSAWSLSSTINQLSFPSTYLVLKNHSIKIIIYVMLTETHGMFCNFDSCFVITFMGWFYSQYNMLCDIQLWATWSAATIEFATISAREFI